MAASDHQPATQTSLLYVYIHMYVWICVWVYTQIYVWLHLPMGTHETSEWTEALRSGRFKEKTPSVLGSSIASANIGRNMKIDRSYSASVCVEFGIRICIINLSVCKVCRCWMSIEAASSEYMYNVFFFFVKLMLWSLQLSWENQFLCVFCWKCILL